MDQRLLRDFMFDVIGRIDKGDVLGVHSENYSIEFEMDRLKSIENKSNFAIGLRVFRDGRVGNSFVNNINGENKEILLKNVFDNVKFGEEEDFLLPEKVDYPDLKLYDENINVITKDFLVEKGFEVLKKLKRVDKEAKVSIQFNKGISETHLYNSNGFEGNYKESSFSVYLNMTYIEKDGGIISVSEGDSFRSPLVKEIDRMCDKLIEKYINSKKKAKINTGYYPVLFSPEALSLVLTPIEIAANGKTLYRKISVLENRVNEKIASEMLSIYDDPIYTEGMDSYPFDDEGVVPKKLSIIENGVFKNFIFDLFTADRMKQQSTGHGRRSVATLPSPSFSNMFIEKGKNSLKEMIGGIDKGLLVYEFLGEGMSNTLAGDFSVNIESGFLIESGEIKGRVKDVMMSGNAFEVLNNIRMIENEIHKHGSLYAPHILIDNISVTE
ncbi:MAG: TldD/PmbA family protein [Brevinematales bacterium]|nr:TldD/PmbA family protein [Brevinematales bacterium]